MEAGDVSTWLGIAGFVGSIGAVYGAARAALSSLIKGQEQLRLDLAATREALDEHERSCRGNIERLVRVETKLDTLLQSHTFVSHGPVPARRETA